MLNAVERPNVWSYVCVANYHLISCHEASRPQLFKTNYVNVSLKLWSLNMAYMLLTFFSKNTCELDIVLTRTVNIATINELVKLRMF